MQARNKVEHMEKALTSRDGKEEVTLLQRVKQRVVHLPHHVGLAVLIFATALCFDLYRLADPSIWFDEAFSVELARQPLPLLWHIIFGPEPNMELYYLFLHYWIGFTSLLGLNPTEFVVRSPSAIFAALSAVVVFFLGQRFFGTTVGIVGAGLYLLNDLQLVYAQQTRGYSLQLLLICSAWYSLLVALTSERHTRRWWVYYIITTVLAVYTHLFSLLILLSQLMAVGCFLLWQGSRCDKIRHTVRLGSSLGIIGLLIAPLVISSRHGSKTGWLPMPHPADVYHLFLTICAESKLYLLAVMGGSVLGLLMAILFSLARGRQLLQRVSLLTVTGSRQVTALRQWLPVALALVCWLVVPVVGSYVISQGATRLFSSRYLVTIVPAVCLLVGVGVASLRWRLLQVVLTLAVIVLAAHHVPQYYASAQVEDWNSTTHWLEQRYQPNDGLICYDNVQGCQISVEYYLHAYPSAAHFTDDSPGAYSWRAYGPVNPIGGYEAAVSPSALAAYAAKHPRLFFIVGRLPDDKTAARAQAAQGWLDSHYHFVTQIVTRTVTIRLYFIGATGQLWHGRSIAIS